MLQNLRDVENLPTLQALKILSEKIENLESTILTIVVNPKEILNSKETAKYLGIKLSWLDKLCCKKIITYHKTGKLRYFKISELDKYRLKNIVKSFDDLEDENELRFAKSNGLNSKS